MKRGRPLKAGPGTMIVFDPDLDPDPAPAKVTMTAVFGALANSRVTRMPSARTLARFLALAQAAVRLRGQVTVLLTTDAAMRRLNRRFRGKNKATDVLSFPVGPVHGAAIAGDLAISVPTAARQAGEQGHSLATEIKVLMLHGLLHLAGYDHEIDEGKMARRELVVRARLGLTQGLIERAASWSPTLPQKTRKDGAPSHFSGISRAKRTSGAKAQGGSVGLIVGVKTPTYQSRAHQSQTNQSRSAKKARQ